MTYEEADALFIYDPETGLLTYRVSRSRARAGAEAGSMSGTRYRQVEVENCGYLVHRVAWLLSTGAWPVHGLDHINGDRLDNRLTNLRDVPQRTNARNAANNRRNKSGVSGVWYDKVRDCYTVSINKQHLCREKDFFEAVCARKSAEVKHGYTGRRG